MFVCKSEISEIAAEFMRYVIQSSFLFNFILIKGKIS